MEELFSSKNGKVEYLSDEGIIVMRFIGDMTDEAYFEVWENIIIGAVDKGAKHFLNDQSEIGNVSFKARSMVVIKYIPTIKKKVGENLTVAIVTSKSAIHKSGIRYLVKTFQKLGSFNIEFFDSKREAISWLSQK